jgi:hypothetical protein
MSKNRLLHLAIGLAALPAAVNAQPANEQTSGGLEEVVVTAERREASLQSVPVVTYPLGVEQPVVVDVVDPYPSPSASSQGSSTVIEVVVVASKL